MNRLLRDASSGRRGILAARYVCHLLPPLEALLFFALA